MSILPLARIFTAMASAGMMLCNPSTPRCQLLPVQLDVSRVEKSNYVPHMTFDVASIRESREEHFAYIDNPLHASFYHAEQVPLLGLISRAYGVDIPELIQGLPSWAERTLYDVTGKSDSATDEALAKLSDSDARAEKRHMLQQLLAERFHLSIHQRTEISDTYELIATPQAEKLMIPVHGDWRKTLSTCLRTYAEDEERRSSQRDVL